MQLFGMFYSLIAIAIGWFVRTVVIRFVVFSALFLLVSEIMAHVPGLLPTTSSFAVMFSKIPPSISYFLDVIAFRAGLAIVFSAYAVRFIIRRLPVVG